jgi:hypothetical protein
VPLARLGRRVFTTNETMEADLEVAHFGAAPLAGAVTTWKLVADDGLVVAQGELPERDIPVDNGIALGSVKMALARIPAPARYKLVVSVAAGVSPAVEGRHPAARTTPPDSRSSPNSSSADRRAGSHGPATAGAGETPAATERFHGEDGSCEGFFLASAWRT